MSAVVREKHISPDGRTLQDLEKSLFTPEEIAAERLKAQVIIEMIKARQKKGVTQQGLAELTGIPQPNISRLEKGEINTSMETVIRVLASVGKTLKVVNLK